MQDLSFDLHNQLFEFNGLKFSVQIFTYENVYSLDKNKCHITKELGKYSIKCEGLTWAGGQELAEGWVRLEALAQASKTTFKLEAKCSKTIRCVKLVLNEITPGVIVNLRETPAKEIPANGLSLLYPDGWRGLYTPLVVIQPQQQDQDFLYFRSLDPQVQQKRFVFVPKEATLDVELVFEETASKQSNQVLVPAWEVGTCERAEDILEQQAKYLELQHKLNRWEERSDVPAWAKEISLVAAIHCQHYTGYVFNDYAKVLDTLQYLAERIEPQKILAYLPGWEGRYYWQYGDYRPDPRMGGEVGFARLMQGAKALGVHVMPMFGINVVNRNTENFEQWGATSLTSHAGGMPGAGSVDRDGSRHYDHARGALLNPGAPGWQNRLVSQIIGLIEKYGFEGVFLDISAAWLNDPRYNTYEGILKLVQRVREDHPEVLIGGEGWYDAIGLATPLMQAGHTEGVLNWHDNLQYPAFFDKYNRSFAHLCLGDPGRGSTGVHELGYNPITTSPLRRGIIPTITIVEDTLQKASGKVEEIIEAARQYADLYFLEAKFAM